MAKNRIKKQVALGAENAWVQITIAQSGKEGVIRTAPNTKATATLEVALSATEPAAAGTVLAVNEGTRYLIANAATHTLWVRATNADAVGGKVEVAPDSNGNVLFATA